ncbi:hypothetical protein ICM05_09950 [Leucobacter sp. cx-42]|uniref:InlB B-repeat-containing protein n=1 Tax=unclassified Leucobacter TaxID=2621730 RepID=UPI00165E95D5|nr:MULTISPECIES: hypothetical protein [unclassified Leucobacter]MBC9954960.1 hypothetical protein [Leucobacter sp. cx-42]
MKRRRSFNPKMLFATLSAGLLATVGIFSASTAAVAASEEIVVDQEFVFDGVKGASLGTSGSKFAQPFIPSSSGTLDSITLDVWTIGEYEFGEVNIHTISADNVISEDPIPGGNGVTSFATWPNDPDVATATATFSMRPELSTGQRYVIIVDPRPTQNPSAYGASFPMVFSGNTDYALRVQSGDTWGPFWITGHIYFSIRFAVPIPDSEVIPEAPTVTPASDCGVRGSVNLPTQDGVKFVQVGDGDEVTVTATPEDGYMFPRDALATWTLDVRPTVCPPTIVAVSPSEPILTEATCEAPGSVATVKQDGITYTVTGSQARTVVTATAQAGYEFPAATKTEWTFDLSKLTCGDPTPTKHPVPNPSTLANTGVEAVPSGIWIGVLLASAGAATTALMSIRRTRSISKQ